MESKRVILENYFTEKITQGQAREQELTQDERKSEAIFARVQTNVYDIFKTIVSAGAKSVGEDEEKLRQFFMQRLEQIPQSWHMSLAQAEAHDDIEKAHIEHLKLAVVDEIKVAVEKIWRE